MQLRRSPVVLGATAAGLALLLSYRTPPPRVRSVVAAPVTSAGQREAAGAPATTPNGPVQVAVVVQGGLITHVLPIALPADNAHSVELSARAGPILEQEAIAAQDADVLAVSGATMTSTAFMSSLQSALSQLHVARR